MGHKNDGEAHQTDKRCIFQHQHLNSVWICKVSIILYACILIIVFSNSCNQVQVFIYIRNVL